MRNPRTNFCLLTAAAVTVLALTTGPSLAQNEPVPCSAFARNTGGGWKVTAPVMLDLNGMLLAPMVGTTFVAGSSARGIEMSQWLDRECGNNLSR